MKGLRLGSWAAGLAFLCLQLGQVQGGYMLTDLNSGGGQGKAYAINNLGQVVGVTYNDHDFWRAAIFNSTTKEVKELSTPYISGPSGTRDSTAWDINDRGIIVGEEIDNNHTTRAVLFKVDDAENNTNLTPAGGTGNVARGINNQETAKIVGQINQQAATFDLLGGANSIAALPEQQPSQAYAINDKGQIVGNATFSNQVHATRFTPDGIIDLAPSLVTSCAISINNNSMIVGYGVDNSGCAHAMKFDPAGNGYADLGTLGGPSSMAQAINDNGQIVGWAFNGNVDMRATLFGPNGNIDLNSVVDNWDDFQNHNLYSLVCAYDINDRGQIVGYMTIPNGTTHAFLLTPNPEPSTLLLMIGMGWSFKL